MYIYISWKKTEVFFLRTYENFCSYILLNLYFSLGMDYLPQLSHCHPAPWPPPKPEFLWPPLHFLTTTSTVP